MDVTLDDIVRQALEKFYADIVREPWRRRERELVTAVGGYAGVRDERGITNQSPVPILGGRVRQTVQRPLGVQRYSSLSSGRR